MLVVSLGYSNEIVLNHADGLLLMDILARAEKFESRYNSGNQTYHVYPHDAQFNVRLITDAMYNMAKLAGQPE